MNKDQIKKSLGHHVRIRPIANRFDGVQRLDVIDDDWIISRADEHVELTNVRTGHVAALGYDHIFGYVSEPGRNRGGIKYGFLQLRVQVSLRGQQLAIEPLPPGDWGQASEQPSPEDALQKAKRVNAQAKAHADRERLLETKGSEAVRKEHESVRTILDQKIIELQPHLTAIKIERGSDGHEYLLRTDRVSLNFYLYPTYPVTESRIVVQEFDGALILPKDRGHRMFVAGEEPRQVSKKEFYFDYREPLDWYWAEKGANKAALDSAGLADQIIGSSRFFLTFMRALKAENGHFGMMTGRDAQGYL